MNPYEVVFKTCLGLKNKESILIITDKEKQTIAQSFLKTALSFGNPAKLLLISIPSVSGTEPSPQTATEMLNHDIILMITTKSFTHTDARRKASAKGARVASMPGITDDMLQRCVVVDYDAMKQLTDQIADRLDAGTTVRITTPKGTDLTFSIAGRKAHGRKGGFFLKPGNYGNIPDGEAFIAPVEGTANGFYVVDACQAGIGLVKELKITVKDGYAINVEGKHAEKLNTLLNVAGPLARNIAEFGIGTNPKAKITGITLEDEKVLGTCHIALGNNIGFDGKVDVKLHLDGVIRSPTLFIDGKKVMEEGRIIV
ncbi:aminopeptidase [Candidatus Woesearchaeota archaeon]|nr:aminopeptidase [Candidatus Woesearchaeota archaeon]